MTGYRPPRAFVRSRHVASLTAAASIISAAIFTVGKRWAELPSVSGSAVQLQIWMILACGLATLPAALADSELAELEEAASGTLRRHELLLIIAGVAATGALLAGTVWLRVGIDAALLSLRILAAWLGLALLSGRLFGTHRFWALPGIALVLVNVTNSTPAPLWVQVITGVPEHWPSLLCATSVLAVGLLARYLTPWRMKTLRRFRASRLNQHDVLHGCSNLVL